MMSFREFWSEAFGSVPPLGWRLREELPRAWFRIHTLPDAKRYATSDAERAEVLHRQCAMAEHVLGRCQPCWVTVPSWTGDATPYDDFPGLELARAFEQDVDDGVASFWAARSTWEPGRFSDALSAIADDRLRAIWVSDDHRVFAPYDGGVDVIVRDPRSLAELKLRFASWRSRHPRGL